MPKMRARYVKWPLSLLIFSVSLLICTANGSDSNDVVGLLHTMEENCDGKDACVNENIDRLINSLSKGQTVDREIGSDDLSKMTYLMKLVDNECGADLICLDHLYDTFRDQIADAGDTGSLANTYLANTYLEDESENIDEINYLGVGPDIDGKYYDMMVLSAKFEDEMETILEAQQKELREERKQSREERREMYKRMSDEEKKQYREDRKQNRKNNRKERQEKRKERQDKRKQKRGERNDRKEARQDKKEDRQTKKEERRRKKEDRQIERERRRQARKDKMKD